MKIKITKAAQSRIEQLRKQIKRHREEEDKEITAIAATLNITDPADQTTLWDYIYNDSAWMVNLTDK